MNKILHQKRDLADVIVFRILSWEDYSELSVWVQYNHNYPFGRETESESEIMVETQIAMMRKGPQAKECR